MTIKILIVDDHAVVRQGLRMFLNLDPDLEVIGEASDGQQGIHLARQLKPDVILMDLAMPVMDGITAIGVLHRDMPAIEIVALTSVVDDDSVIGAIRAGAIGYLLKDTEAEDLIRSIRAAAHGQVQLSPKVAAKLIREVRTPEPVDNLTERETEVLKMLARGLSNKEIAQALVVGETTVKTHVSNVLSKLGVTSRTHAALYAVKNGLVPAANDSVGLR